MTERKATAQAWPELSGKKKQIPGGNDRKKSNDNDNATARS